MYGYAIGYGAAESGMWKILHPGTTTACIYSLSRTLHITQGQELWTLINFNYSYDTSHQRPSNCRARRTLPGNHEISTNSFAATTPNHTRHYFAACRYVALYPHRDKSPAQKRPTPPGLLQARRRGSFFSTSWTGSRCRLVPPTVGSSKRDIIPLCHQVPVTGVRKYTLQNMYLCLGLARTAKAVVNSSPPTPTPVNE